MLFSNSQMHTQFENNKKNDNETVRRGSVANEQTERKVISEQGACRDSAMSSLC